MNCHRVQRLLSMYHDGHPPGREADAVAEHLQVCPTCLRFRSSFVAIGSTIRQVSDSQPGPRRDLRRRAIDRSCGTRTLPRANRRGPLLPGWPMPASRPARLGVLSLVTFGTALCFLWRLPGGRSAPPARQLVGTAPLGHPVRPSRSTPWERGRPARGTSRPGADGTPALPGSLPGTTPGPPSPKGIPSRDAGSLQDAGGRLLTPAAPSPDAPEEIEARVRRLVRVRDDFVQVPFPRLASTSDRQITQAVESYRREAAIVDLRLTGEVTVQQKATALADLCERLRGDTGIQLAAGTSVADEKVTLFCEKVPLRDVMRQMSRPFGYAWLRSGKEGQYRYELVQDLRSQLLEEELRNRDRNAALLALETEIERYRPYLSLSPDEAQARAKTAPPADKELLEKLAGVGWGCIQMYFRLSSQQLAALRSGQSLTFSAQPDPGQQPLPLNVARGVLQSHRGMGVIPFEGVDIGFILTTDFVANPQAVPVTAAAQARASVTLSINQPELGRFALDGHSGVFVGGQPGRDGIVPETSYGSGPYAVGVSPVVHRLENGTLNARLARDPALRLRVTLQPLPSCGRAVGPSPGARPAPAAESQHPSVQPKVSCADALEAIHRATGLPLISDFYTRLYKPEAAAVRKQPLFDALNQVADAIRVRWNKEGGWLQFRSATYYDDRLKEVPNRLLTRWTAERQKHGMLPLDEVIEIAQLPDAQLDGAEMAEGARECLGLQEWALAQNGNLRLQLRYLARFTPEQRQQVTSSEGLPFTQMSLGQQQQFIAGGVIQPLQSLEDLAGAALRVEYTQPGEFEWQMRGELSWLQRVLPIGAGPQGRRALMPLTRARTREAALATARRIEPPLRAGLLKAGRSTEEVDRLLQATEVVPTHLDLGVLYFTGTSNRLLVAWFSRWGDNHTGRL